MLLPDSKAHKELMEWLMDHERDIAFGIEDFDCLRHVFEVLIGRAARK